MASLASCGGGGGSNNSGGATASAATPGKVIDGYIQHAVVCHDSDNDFSCDDEANTAISAADGSFSLQNYDPTQTLMVHAKAGVAIDNGPFVDGSSLPRSFAQDTRYFFPAQGLGASTQILVGPLSTLVYATMQVNPGSTVEDAVAVVAYDLAVTPSAVLSDYIAQGDTQLNFIAELVGAALANATSSTAESIASISLDLANTVNVATTNNASTYDTGSYSSSGSARTAAVSVGAFGLVAETDFCSVLSSKGYFAFEDWASQGGSVADKEHKTLFLQSNAGAQLLHINEYTLDNSNNWQLAAEKSSTSSVYTSQYETVFVDMDTVNTAALRADIPSSYHLLPATLQSCSGASGLFSHALAQFRLIAAYTDLSGVSGSDLVVGSPPSSGAGESIDPLLNSVVFSQAAKAIKLQAVLQNNVYLMDVSMSLNAGTLVPGSPQNHTVYRSSTVPSGNPVGIGSSFDFQTMAVATTFVVEYDGPNDYVEIKINSLQPNNAFAASVTQYRSSGPSLASMSRYALELHNGTEFLVIDDPSVHNEKYFLGRVNSASSSDMVWGKVIAAGKVVPLSQGLGLDGDVLDDLLLNKIGRDDILNAQIPTLNAPSFP